MKQILHCTLIFMVLVTSGCGFFSDESSSPTPSTKSSPTPPREQEKNIDFEGAALDIDNASRTLKQPNVTVGAAVEEINLAIQKLGKDKDDITKRCVGCSEDMKNAALAFSNTLNGLSNKLGKDPLKNIDDLDKEVRTNLSKELTAEADKLRALSIVSSRTGENSSVGSSLPTTETKKDETGGPWWWDALILTAEIVAGLLVLTLLVGAVKFLWNRSWKTLESNVGKLVKAHVAAARDGQPDYASKLSSLASTQADINSKLNELDTEVRSLARLIRDSLSRRPDRNPSYQSYGDDVSPKEEPEFPVSATNYLDKMNRFANVVKPDFQNGILINDPEGAGEFVLIRDSRDDAQPLFVIPRATQFHTKQDFYTYYQKYYDCVRPTAGDVWIIGPAVVEKVTGGWQLREKGMLEVR
jgi:hypothetical protein